MVVVAELVARISASGVQETAQQIKAVGAEAAVTQRALENMANAYAQKIGGTASQALEMFQRQGAIPNVAAVAEAQRQLQQTAMAHAETTRAVQKTSAAYKEFQSFLATPQGGIESAAKSSGDLAKGFELSGSNVLRVAGALTGVGLGLNIAAGAAAQLHAEIAAAATAAVDFDRAGRALSATYGASAPGVASFARGLAGPANLTVSATERALTAAGPLSNQYGLRPDQIQQLSSRSVDLAAKFGQPSENVLGATFEAVQSGGNQLQQYNVRLDDTYLKTIAWNGALAGTYDKMTQAQQAAVRYQAFLDQTKTAQGSAATSADTLSGSLDRLGGSFARLREANGTAATGGVPNIANALSNWIDSLTAGPQSAATQRHAIVADPSAPNGARIITGPPQFDLSASLAGQTAPLSFIGPRAFNAGDLLNDPTRLQGPAGGLAAAAQAGIPDIGRASGAQLADLAVRRAESTMLANQVASRNRANDAGLEGQLNVALSQATTGDDRNRLSQQLATLKEYRGVMAEVVAAEHDQAGAQREIATAQSSLTEITIRQSERQADLALQTLDVRRQDLQAQQNIQRLGVGLTQAQISALPATNAAADLDYSSQRIQLLGQVRMARLLKGQSVADLPSIDELIRGNVATQLDRPAIALRALDATRAVDLAQRPVTAATLGEHITAAPLDAAGLALALKNLDDLPDQTKSLKDLYAGQVDLLAAERASRDSLAHLATLADKQPGSVTVPITLTINGASTDTVSIVKRELADFEQRIANALFASDGGGPPASPDLAGARHGPPPRMTDLAGARHQ